MSAIGCKNSAIVRDWLRLAAKRPHPVPGKCTTRFRGKVPPIRGKMVHFPREKRRNGGRINIFGGKVHQKSGKMVHFSPRQNADTSPVSKKREGVILRISIFFLQHLYTKLKFLPRIQAELYNENSNVKPWTLSRSDNERSILGEQGFRHFVSHAIGSPLDEGTNPFSFLFPI